MGAIAGAAIANSFPSRPNTSNEVLVSFKR